MSLNLADLFLNFWSGLLLDRKCKESWELSTERTQFYPLDSCPLDKELSSGQPYTVDNFIQYSKQLGPGGYILKG